MSSKINFSRILIVRTDRMGDVVLTTPFIKALRRAYPAAHIATLVKPETKDLVIGNPYLDEVLVDDRAGRHKGVPGALRLAREIRRGNFDTAFILHTKRRYNFACFLAGVPARIGYRNDKMGFLLTHPLKDVRHLGEKHESEYCLDVLKGVGIPADIEDVLGVLVPVHKDADTWVLNWLNSQGIKAGEFIAMHPGASDPAKCWPAASFAALIRRLIDRYDFKVVLIGGPQTVTICGEIMRLCPASVMDLSGRTSVAQSAALLSRCRLLISNDSGPVHLAAGVGVFVISLFLRDQPGINPKRWKPLGPKGFFLSTDSVTVDKVLDLVEDILHKDSQGIFYW
ncbi:MAG: glycosyltransferase family 9 protein [Candidatus Omnitrophica bacterium]|nr:glycosyltransferase family 9 protein [Candidatus Omnitrophota bacterium]